MGLCLRSLREAVRLWERGLFVISKWWLIKKMEGSR